MKNSPCRKPRTVQILAWHPHPSCLAESCAVGDSTRESARDLHAAARRACSPSSYRAAPAQPREPSLLPRQLACAAARRAHVLLEHSHASQRWPGSARCSSAATRARGGQVPRLARGHASSGSQASSASGSSSWRATARRARAELVLAAAATGPADRTGSGGDRHQDFRAARRWEMDKAGRKLEKTYMDKI
jgi:hypothetical protein